MTKVVSIYLPDLPTERIRRADPSISPEQPIAVIARSQSAISNVSFVREVGSGALLWIVMYPAQVPSAENYRARRPR
ncbi:hypothetical protein FHT28_006598 [Rhizobium sp. SG570]|nr:hypothetical protein [Rhizobium sp. SG570]